MGKVFKFNPRRKRWRRTARRMLSAGWLPLAALIVVAPIAYSTIELQANSVSARSGGSDTGQNDFGRGEFARGDFGLCGGAYRQNCVIDGDTIRYKGAKIRLNDIDAPEVFSPKCASEKALGKRATHRLLELMNAGPFELVRDGGRDRDRYGRKLRRVERHGRSLGGTLVAEGLARRWDGRRRTWCG